MENFLIFFIPNVTVCFCLYSLAHKIWQFLYQTAWFVQPSYDCDIYQQSCKARLANQLVNGRKWICNYLD